MPIERVDVICPFYHHDDGKRSITCEGLYDGSTLIQRFNGKRPFTRQLEHYCFRHCADCGLFRMLLREKYTDD